MTVVITGLGFEGALASGAPAFSSVLAEGRSQFSRLRLPRSGREVVASCYHPLEDAGAVGARISSPAARRLLRERPEALGATCAAALEALAAAGWSDSDAALVVAGNNPHQAHIAACYERFLAEPEYVNPRYAASFLDSTVVAAISELGGLRAIGMTVGGGMASGNVALFQGWTLVRAGVARACLVVGAMVGLSELELVAFGNLGVLAEAPASAVDPAAVSRPFDRGSAGFAYGQAAGAVVLEHEESAAERGAPALARLTGAAITLDGDAGTEPSVEGEAAAIRAALAAADLGPAAVGYVNTHGTGTPAGDHAECVALRRTVGTTPRLNATKALTGHTLGAAGVVELVATVSQLRGGFVHPNPHLRDPVDPDLGFVGPAAEPFAFEVGLSTSFSIGGINTAVVVAAA